MQLNRQQQQEFAQRLNDELEKVTMSWDNDLKRWYVYAIAALDHASSYSLKVPQKKFITLFETTTHGINMNVITVLCNNIEERTPHQMNVTAKDWADVLFLNDTIATRWQFLVDPIQQRILKGMEIMQNKPKILASA